MSVSKFLSNAQGFGRNMNNVVVAKVDIPLGTKVLAEHLTTANFPERHAGWRLRVGGQARRPRRRHQRGGARAGDGVQAGGRRNGSRTRGSHPEGYRAMAVKVDDVMGVSGFLKPGAMVDV